MATTDPVPGPGSPHGDPHEAARAPTVAAADEAAHPPEDDPWWNESWYFDFAAPDGSIGGYARIGLYPAQRVVWYWAAVVRPGRPTVLVRDHEVALPRRPGSLEIRHEGLWAEHTCDAPLEQWSLGLEAFGVALEHPADAFAGERGERVPVGFDLEWGSVAPPYHYPGVDRYEVACEVVGEVLVGDERHEVHAVGERDHSWGRRDWWQLGWWWTTFTRADGATVHGMTLDAPGLDYHAGFVAAGGELVEQTPGFVAADELDGHGLLVRSQMRYGDTAYDVEPLGHAPLLLADTTASGPRVTRFARSLCRWTDRATGLDGVGWYERNQPQPPPV